MIFKWLAKKISPHISNTHPAMAIFKDELYIAMNGHVYIYRDGKIIKIEFAR